MPRQVITSNNWQKFEHLAKNTKIWLKIRKFG